MSDCKEEKNATFQSNQKQNVRMENYFTEILCTPSMQHLIVRDCLFLKLLNGDLKKKLLRYLKMLNKHLCLDA